MPPHLGLWGARAPPCPPPPATPLAAPKLLVAQVAGRKAARAGGRALDAALLDGGLHTHAILRMPPLARVAGQRAHFVTAIFFLAKYQFAALARKFATTESEARVDSAVTARPPAGAGHFGRACLL